MFSARQENQQSAKSNVPKIQHKSGMIGMSGVSETRGLKQPNFDPNPNPIINSGDDNHQIEFDPDDFKRLRSETFPLNSEILDLVGVKHPETVSSPFVVELAHIHKDLENNVQRHGAKSIAVAKSYDKMAELCYENYDFGSASAFSLKSL